jgi:hypothetical protein
MSGISSHGTVIERQDDGVGAFVEVANIGDLTPPSLGRNEFDVTTHNNDIDQYILGVLRRGQVTFPFNFIPKDGTHDHLTGLYKSVIEHQTDGWRITFPDEPSPTVWVFSGGISNIVPTAPVDGALSANVTIRPTGTMTIGAVTVGG